MIRAYASVVAGFGLVVLARRRLGGAGAGARLLHAELPAASASPDERRGDVPGPAARDAAAAHEPLVAGPLRHARLREERVRPGGHRRRGPAADLHPAEPAP